MHTKACLYVMHAHKVIVHTCVCSHACIGACCYTWIFIHSYVYMCDLSSRPRSDLQKLRNTNPEGKSGLHNISGRCLLSQVSAEVVVWFALPVKTNPTKIWEINNIQAKKQKELGKAYLLKGAFDNLVNCTAISTSLWNFQSEGVPLDMHIYIVMDVRKLKKVEWSTTAKISGWYAYPAEHSIRISLEICGVISPGICLPNAPYVLHGTLCFIVDAT